MHHRSHVPSQSFSKAVVVLTIAVKVLGMLQHTYPISLNWSWYWETFIKSSCQNAQFLRSINRQEGDQFFYQMSDFCKNCNPHSSYHTTAVGEYLVDIWFAEICQLTLFLEVNPCFQRAHVFCMDLQPTADPYNVACRLVVVLKKGNSCGK